MAAFTVAEKHTGELVGETMLFDFDRTDLRAEVG